MNKDLPVVFAIKRCASHDGSNIRTTVFLKGCPLSCWWCHNPEGLIPQIQMVADYSKCIGCKECISACEFDALQFEERHIVKDDSKCTMCYGCLEICPAMVFETTGWKSTVKDLVKEIKKDVPFFDQSGGNVTFSGGDPLMQAPQLIELLKECGKLSIHRTVDTSCFAKAETVLEVAKETDLFLIDLKIMDNNKHKEYTGVSNENILKNIQMLAEQDAEMIIRIPLIPGINDMEENIKASAEFIKTLSKKVEVEVLPYHSGTKAKYKKLNMEYLGQNIPASSKNNVQKNINILREYGLHARAG